MILKHYNAYSELKSRKRGGRKMVNYEKLNAAVKNSGFKKSFIAENLGLTPYGLAKKLTGETEFKASEMFNISELLNLNSVARDEFFFAQ